MITTIDELIEQIRGILPQSNSIKQFTPDEKGGFVSFYWNGHGFVVKKTMEVFELKNQRVFVTGASILMQSALSSKSKHQRVLEACVEVLRQVEAMFGNKKTTEQGLKLLATTKVTISKLAGTYPKIQRPA